MRDAADRSAGNRLALIGSGYDALLLRVHLIRQAKAAIGVHTFIRTNDECDLPMQGNRDASQSLSMTEKKKRLK